MPPSEQEAVNWMRSKLLTWEANRRKPSERDQALILTHLQHVHNILNQIKSDFMMTFSCFCCFLYSIKKETQHTDFLSFFNEAENITRSIPKNCYNNMKKLCYTFTIKECASGGNGWEVVLKNRTWRFSKSFTWNSEKYCSQLQPNPTADHRKHIWLQYLRNTVCFLFFHLKLCNIILCLWWSLELTLKGFIPNESDVKTPTIWLLAPTFTA